MYDGRNKKQTNKEVVSSGYNMFKPCSIMYLVNAITQEFIFSNIFSSLTLLEVEFYSLQDHICLLIKCIAAKYLAVLRSLILKE